MSDHQIPYPYHTSTRMAIIWHSLLSEPLLYLYGLLAFFLRKSCGASAFELSLLMMLKPTVSVLSLYWSSRIRNKVSRLKPNLIGAGVLSRLPFLLFPFVDNVWFFVVAAAIHMLFQRAGIPAWMEILKLNVPKEKRKKLFSLGSALGYSEGVILAVGVGALLDQFTHLWKWLFFISAVVGMWGVYIQSKTPVFGEENCLGLTPKEKMGFKESLLKPWCEAYDLIKEKADFAKFQLGFFLCGFGVMLIQPVLPLFFIDTLHLSYTELGVAITIFKGLGFVLSSPLWARGVGRFKIHTLSSLVFLFTGLFPFLLLLAAKWYWFVYIAYLFYGIAQGGSHLVWNMAGPLFSEKENSSTYSSVNVLMVGIRGIIAPPIGGVLLAVFNPLSVLIIGMLFCFGGGVKMLRKKSTLPKSVSLGA